MAFTIGSAINDEAFCIHVEKADTRYDGAFTMINRLFAQHLPPHYTLIDREEDLGLEGLRQSKLSYHPLSCNRNSRRNGSPRSSCSSARCGSPASPKTRRTMSNSFC